MCNDVLDFPPELSAAGAGSPGKRRHGFLSVIRGLYCPPAVDVLALKECFIYWTGVAFGSLMSLWAKSGSANLQRHRGEEGEEDVPAALDPLFPSCHAAFYVTRDLC